MCIVLKKKPEDKGGSVRVIPNNAHIYTYTHMYTNTHTHSTSGFQQKDFSECKNNSGTLKD